MVSGTCVDTERGCLPGPPAEPAVSRCAASGQPPDGSLFWLRAAGGLEDSVEDGVLGLAALIGPWRAEAGHARPWCSRGAWATERPILACSEMSDRATSSPMRLHTCARAFEVLRRGSGRRERSRRGSVRWGFRRSYTLKGLKRVPK
jgi:hypothetical protein